MRKVKLTKAFANKKKGEVISCDSQLASQLVRVKKVAQYADTRGETDEEIKAERKLELEAKVLDKLTKVYEDKYQAEFEAEITSDIESGNNESFLKSVKKRIFDKLNVEFSEPIEPTE